MIKVKLYKTIMSQRLLAYYKSASQHIYKKKKEIE